MLDESRYLSLVDSAWKEIDARFEDVDPDLAEVTNAGDVVTIQYPKGVRCIINTQRPVRQIWLAARDTAIHFNYDEPSGRWFDDRGRGIELFAYLRTLTKDLAGIDLR
ncbi:MAG: iron donor protein CyaY [Deltaproteobacteria bacterium]|nr:iron donor protein CyaY [Deltaproteobacteria bacterium]